MEKVKEYRYIIILIIVFLSLFFYWYEYKPSVIRAKCNRISNVGWTQNGEINYKSCLRDNGLEK